MIYLLLTIWFISYLVQDLFFIQLYLLIWYHELNVLLILILKVYLQMNLELHFHFNRLFSNLISDEYASFIYARLSFFCCFLTISFVYSKNWNLIIFLVIEKYVHCTFYFYLTSLPPQISISSLLMKFHYF